MYRTMLARISLLCLAAVRVFIVGWLLFQTITLSVENERLKIEIASWNGRPPAEVLFNDNAENIKISGH